MVINTKLQGIEPEEEIVTWSEGYATKQNAIAAANWVKQYAASVPIQDKTQLLPLHP